MAAKSSASAAEGAAGTSPDEGAVLAQWRASATDGQVVEFPGGAPVNRADVDVTPEVKVGQIRLLYLHPSLILFNLLNALLVTVVLWRVYPDRLLIGWFALFLIVIPIRLLVARLQWQQHWPATRAATWAIIGSFATGALWGSWPGRF